MVQTFNRYLNVMCCCLCSCRWCGLLLVMGYFKNVEVFGQVEEPDREGVVLLSSKLMTITVREWLTIVIGLSLSLITNVGLIIWIAGLL